MNATLLRRFIFRHLAGFAFLINGNIGSFSLPRTFSGTYHSSRNLRALCALIIGRIISGFQGKCRKFPAVSLPYPI
jgi:hypothetical protein